MKLYISASANTEYTVSAYSFICGSGDPTGERFLKATVVEALFRGIVDMSGYIIKNNLHTKARKFTVISPNKLILGSINDGLFEHYADNGWRTDDGVPLVHKQLFMEWQSHLDYYKERNILWAATQECNKVDLDFYNKCKDSSKLLAEGVEV